MKMRAIVIVDYEFSGVIDAADQLKALREAVAIMLHDNKSVKFFDVDMKERRGTSHLNVKEMKLVNR